MSKQLMPYGSSSHGGLVAKCASIKIDFFQPYGSAQAGELTAKVSAGGAPPPIPMPPKTITGEPATKPQSRVKRRNAGKAGAS